MNSRKESHQHTADHHEVEVGHNEIGLGQMDVGACGAQEDAGQAANGKQAHESEGIEHRSLKGDGTLVEGEGPVENLDGRGHGYEHGQQRKHQRRIGGDTHDKHVVLPNKEAEHRNRHRREGDGSVAEHAFSAESRDHLGDDTHARKNHDVDGGVRIKPEQVLEQDGVAALGRVENADAQSALQCNQNNGDGQHRRAQHHQDAGGIVSPHKQR